MIRILQRHFSLLPLALILAACTGFPSRMLETPSVNVVDLRPTQIGLFEQHYAVALRIQNPNPFPLPMQGMSLKMQINGQDFAQAVSRQSVDIPAFGEQIVNVDVISTLGKVVNILQRGSDTSKPIRYSLSGSISLANRLTTIPFEYQGEIGLISGK